MTDNTKPSVPTAEQEKLGALIGVWRAEWETEATDSEPSVKIIGTDTYEWLRGGFSLIHYVNSPMDGYDYKATEIIGYDAPNKTYRSYTFDNQGESITYDISVEDNVWHFTGENQRARLVVGEDGNTMSAKWDQRDADSDEWRPWITMAFTRME